jgi:spoIIIJ-associated protein
MATSEWLEGLLDLMGFGLARVEELEADRLGNRWLVINGSQLNSGEVGYLTGENGCGLDALQYITNLVFNQGHTYIVELNGFRKRQLALLHDRAMEALAIVRQTQTSYTISHLSPGERRYIHLLLREYDDVETFSEGEEPNRQLVVRWIGETGA